MLKSWPAPTPLLVPAKFLSVLALALSLSVAARAAGHVSTDCGGAATGCAEAKPFRDRPHTSVRLQEVSGTQPLELKIYLLDGDHKTELPRFYGSTRWSSCGIPTDKEGRALKNAVVAGDFAGTGHEDLAVMGECMTGIGPTGAEPFLAGSIYIPDESGTMHVDEAASGRFTELLRTRCGTMPEDCDVADLARTAVR